MAAKLYNGDLMKTVLSCMAGLIMSVSLALPSIASSKPEPLASMRLLKDESGPIKVRSKSENGVSLRVVFDTAAASSILFEHGRTTGVGDRLEQDQYVYFPFTDRILDFRQLGFFTLKLGDHRFSSNSWVYGPWKSTGLFPGRNEPNYDVIAGRDVFINFAVAVDPKKRRVRLYESGQDLSSRYDTSVDIIDLNPLMGVKVTVSRADTGELSEKLMIVDTGFPGVLLFADDQELEELKADEFTAPADTIGNALIAPGRIKLGDLPFKEHTALVVSKGAFEADGIIGTSFLANYSYAFDLLEKKLYLTELR